MNARFALNAANARWGSLYDAMAPIYIEETEQKIGAYNPVRGTRLLNSQEFHE